MNQMGAGMKFIYAIAFFLCATPYVQAQNEQILIERRADTIVVTNKNVNENCAARFQIDVSVLGPAVVITETDTVWQKARCMCHFDLSAFLTGLQAGSYTVEVHRQYLKKFNYSEDKKILEGVATFDVVQPNPAPPFVRCFQSECHQLSGTQGAPSPYEISLRVFPNPSKDEVTVQLNALQNEPMELSFRDELGAKIGDSQIIPNDVRRNYSFSGRMFPRTGTYFCIVSSSYGTNVVPFTILK